MTATLAAMQVESGKLRWDTTIIEALPALKGQIHRDFEAVTLEMLLQHRGELPTDALPAAWKRAREKIGTPTEQRSEFVAAVLAKEPASKPGTKFTYSKYLRDVLPEVGEQERP